MLLLRVARTSGDKTKGHEYVLAGKDTKEKDSWEKCAKQ